MGNKLTTKLKAVEEKVAQFALSAASKAQYQQGKVSASELAGFVSALKALSERYISSQSVLMSQAEVSAYALYYLPVNLAKLSFLISSQLNYPPGRAIKVLDFGCGPGSGALACLDSVGTAAEITLFDQSKNCLDFAAELIHSINPHVKIDKIHDLKKLAGLKFDLVIAANVFTEMHSSQRETVIDLLASLVKPDSSLLIVEPALKDKTQALMHDRDSFLLSHPEFSVQFPCTHQKACPMNKQGSGDWCHGQLPAAYWQSPPLCAQLDKLLGFNKHRIKYSAFLYTRRPAADISAARIIQTSDNKQPALICSSDGLLRIRPSAIKDISKRRALKATENFGLIYKPY